jgi:predicted CXXCH cytochrome family protein
VKKTTFVLALTALLVLAGAGAAFANFGPHGGYSLDTDACAGCHRAHTSYSTLTWRDNAGDSNSALLVSSATTMEEFCLVCHGNAAPGASTNVVSGIFDAGPSSGVGSPAGSYAYVTNSSFDATLNGGGFSGSTSMHNMEMGAVTDPMWGDGTSAVSGTGITCTSCHDVHGSSNYRLLKDTVNGHQVGGYDAVGNPTPWVYSSETGYPLPGSGSAAGGWLKHEPGAAQMTTYRPNYTTAQYLFSTGTTYTVAAGSGNRSMSVWCSACHEQYNVVTSAYDYGAYESNGAVSRDATGQLLIGASTAQIGSRTRHRHPVDITPGTANIINGFGSDAVTSSVLPLEKTAASAGTPAGQWELTDYMGCLTCHRAHGTSAVMTGFANARLLNVPSSPTSWSIEPTTVAPAGVAPNYSSSLLRVNNRGVCERCHNK